MPDESGQDFSRIDREGENRQIVEGNIGKILDHFPWIDSKHQPGDSHTKRGFRGGNSETYDDGLEHDARIIYETSTGKIIEPPKEFWGEGASERFATGSYSIIDTFLRNEGPEYKPYPDSRYLLRLQLQADTYAPSHAFGRAVEGQEIGQKYANSENASREASSEGYNERARASEDQAAAALAELSTMDERHAKLYQSGQLIFPRRLIPGQRYNEDRLFEPWGESGIYTNPALVNPAGDMIIRQTLNAFNERYGPDWLKALQSL